MSGYKRSNIPVNCDSEAVVVVGRIQGAYGIKGWVRLQSYTDPVENLLDYSPWMLESAAGWQAFESLETRPHKQGFVAALRGITDRTSAAALQGRHIGVAAGVLPATDEDEYYWRDLIGLDVVDGTRTMLGMVTGLLATGAHDVMVISPREASSTDGLGSREVDGQSVVEESELLIPFARRYVLEVDLTAGRIIVDWAAV